MKVLVAMSDPKLRAQLAGRLSHLHYEVTFVSHIQDLQEATRQKKPPGIALVGTLDGDPGGVQSIRALRCGSSDVAMHIIAVVDAQAQGFMPELLDSEFDDILCVPLVDRELEVRLRTATRVVTLQTEAAINKEWMELQTAKDPVTGLLNAAGTADALERELLRSAREDRPLAYAVVRLDFFPGVMDGMPAGSGDLVLLEAAQRLRDTIRAYDTLGRHSTHEFAIVLPGVDRDTLALLGERLRFCIAAKPFVLGQRQVRLTASIALVAVADRTCDDLLVVTSAAEDAIVRAEAKGGNRVEFVLPDGQPSKSRPPGRLSMPSPRVLRSQPS